MQAHIRSAILSEFPKWDPSTVHQTRDQVDFDTLRATANQVVARSHEVLQTYEMLSRKNKKANTVNWEAVAKTWQADKEQVAELLKKGRQSSLKRILKVMPKATNETLPEQTTDNSYGNVPTHFKQPPSEDTRLQETFRQTSKGVKRMIKELSKNEV